MFSDAQMYPFLLGINLEMELLDRSFSPTKLALLLFSVHRFRNSQKNKTLHKNLRKKVKENALTFTACDNHYHFDDHLLIVISSICASTIA